MNIANEIISFTNDSNDVTLDDNQENLSTPTSSLQSTTKYAEDDYYDIVIDTDANIQLSTEAVALDSTTLLRLNGSTPEIGNIVTTQTNIFANNDEDRLAEESYTEFIDTTSTIKKLKRPNKKHG